MILALAVVIVVLGSATTAQAGARPGRGQPITVMTRNVYVGGDITRPVQATNGKQGAEALLALGHANHELRSIVDQTDFRVRSRLLAREIARARPGLIGLQEVATWRRGPLELDQLGIRNATTVDYDFLELLLDELRDLGAHYRVVAEQQESDVEAPAFLGDLSNPQDGFDVRLTVRDVVLKRVGGSIRVLDSGGAQYRARLDLNLGGLPFPIVRGYAWVDVRAGGRTFRFITTHLESASADLAYAQAAELLAGPAAGDRPTVLVCDCNSRPDSAPYNLITQAGGYADLWLQQRRPGGPGLTFGLGELVDDPTVDGFNRRIDMIFARSTGSSRVAVQRAYVVGDELRDRDRATGLWPSDHAGVVARLRFSTHRHGS